MIMGSLINILKMNRDIVTWGESDTI